MEGAKESGQVQHKTWQPGGDVTPSSRHRTLPPASRWSHSWKAIQAKIWTFRGILHPQSPSKVLLISSFLSQKDSSRNYLAVLNGMHHISVPHAVLLRMLCAKPGSYFALELAVRKCREWPSCVLAHHSPTDRDLVTRMAHHHLRSSTHCCPLVQRALSPTSHFAFRAPSQYTLAVRNATSLGIAQPSTVTCSILIKTTTIGGGVSYKDNGSDPKAARRVAIEISAHSCAWPAWSVCP